ncbi:MAG: hypothetical protein ACYS76_04555 [Planctomycetota bacterium]|jgi:hypothetical protein
MRYRPLIVYFILGLLIVQAYAPSELQTISIVDTEDDGFITESTTLIDSTTLLYTSTTSQAIRAFWYFEDIDIESTEYLNNATLRIRSASALDFDADNSFTLYGLEVSNLQNSWPPGLGGTLISYPTTSASVNVNTSNWYGSAYHDINVTDIVREVISHPSWDGDAEGTGDSIGFISLAVADDTRYFYDYSGSPTYSADLIIGFNDSPTPPAGDTVTFNESYRGFDIWEDDHNGANRTGLGFNVNWNLLNQSALTEIDSGNALTVENDTWTSISAFQAQQINALYNDTGGAGVNSYFVRFAVNVTNVTNTVGGGSEYVATLAGLSTATPVGGAGLAFGAGGSWVGVELVVNVDDSRYLLRMGERFGAGIVHDAVNTGWLTEDQNQVLYCEYLYRTGAGFVNWTHLNVFSDPEYETGMFFRTYQLTVAQPPFRYPQIISSTGPGSLAFFNDGDYYTFLDMPLADNVTYIITDENGTGIGNTTTYPEAIDFIDDMLGGPDPEEPDPAGESYPQTGPFTRFRTRFYILFLGVAMFLGPVMFLAYQYRRGLTARYVAGAFIVMLIGLGFMLAIRQI